MIMGNLYINFRGFVAMWAMSGSDLGRILPNIWTALLMVGASKGSIHV